MKVLKNLNILVVMGFILILQKRFPVLDIVDHVVMLMRRIHLIRVNVLCN